MKKYLLISMILLSLAFWGCGGDDDDDDGGPGPGTTTPRVTAITATSAPSTVNSTQWSGATETAIGISSISFSGKTAGGLTARYRAGRPPIGRGSDRAG